MSVLEWLGERQEIGLGTFGIKSSVRQHSTLEFANTEEDPMSFSVDF